MSSAFYRERKRSFTSKKQRLSRNFDRLKELTVAKFGMKGGRFLNIGKQGCACVAWSRKCRSVFASRQGVYESPRSSSYAPTCGQSVPKLWLHSRKSNRTAGNRQGWNERVYTRPWPPPAAPLNGWTRRPIPQSACEVAFSDFEVFSFSKLNNQNKFFRLKKFYLLSSSMPYFFFCRIT